MRNFTIAIALLVLTSCQAQESTEKSAAGTGGGQAAPAAKESVAKPAQIRALLRVSPWSPEASWSRP